MEIKRLKKKRKVQENDTKNHDNKISDKQKPLMGTANEKG